MTRSSKRREPPAARPLSNVTIAVGAVVVLGIGVAVWIVLLRRYGAAGAAVELDAIRTAGTLLIGTRGAAALLLAARRQRATELTLLHTDRDATERRITELYTKAADQLGSGQAPVRLAGLYALERLANSTAEHRQTIVNVICAYLRMPYAPPAERPPPRSGTYRSPGPHRQRPRSLTARPPTAPTPRHQQTQEERQVRLTAQDILSRNLRVAEVDQRRWLQWKWPPEAAPLWPGISLDLTGALLIDFTLTDCQIKSADFVGAQFSGNAYFNRTRFTDIATFDEAQFSDSAYFSGTRFTGDATFGRAQFSGSAYFSRTRFADITTFKEAQFTGDAEFDRSQFAGTARFEDARFTSDATFNSAQFAHTANFSRAEFISVANSTLPSSPNPPISKVLNSPISPASTTLGSSAPPGSGAVGSPAVSTSMVPRSSPLTSPLPSSTATPTLTALASRWTSKCRYLGGPYVQPGPIRSRILVTSTSCGFTTSIQ